MHQTAIQFVRRGGKRRGAGRKPQGPTAGVTHAKRPRLDGRTPVHVTVRVAPNLPSLRRQSMLAVVRSALAAAKDRLGVRIVHYAIQPDHLHLILEPDSADALGRGMRGLKIRMAKRLNALLRRKGQFFSDRYHARPMTRPTDVRNVLRYVLLQERRHAAKRREPLPTGLDPCSSAAAFDGWADQRPLYGGPISATVVPARTWLLGVGWRSKGGGLIRSTDIPGS